MSSPAASSSSPVLRSLYGGALSVSLPTRFEDVSHFRPVPDHQEVFADTATDQSFIVEVNQLLSCSDEQAGVEHMQELADVSGAVSNAVQSSTALPVSAFPLLSPPPAFASLTASDMLVSKYRDSSSAANAVRVWLLVVRLAREQTDLLLILNSPKAWSEQTSIGSSTATERRAVSDDESEAVMREACSTLRVNDYGLFGDGGAAGMEGDGVQAGVDERMQV